MTLLRRYRASALFCAFALLLCELISRPFAAMGIADDWSYIRTAQNLASTGHIAYNGWATAMIGWQLYLGAAFIKLFGFSFTAVRLSTLLLAALIAFLLQRTLVRAGISERNAVIGTLALVLSPLFMMLSVTFMTDIPGLFALVLCLYSCIRAIQAATSRTTLAWLFFAVFANTVCGSSRQIAWLGVLVMVPSALWLLRSRRSVLLAGASATFVGASSILGAMRWFHRQPFSIPEHLLPNSFSTTHFAWSMFHLVLELPFLLLPLAALFIPCIRKASPRIQVLIVALSLVYLLFALHLRHHLFNPLLEPVLSDWVSVLGIYEIIGLAGFPPLFLNPAVRIALTIASVAGLFGIFVQLPRSHQSAGTFSSSKSLTWRQLSVLIAPFTTAYILALMPRATNVFVDRYLLPLLIVVVILLLRVYQERIHPRLPGVTILFVGIFAIYAVAVTHNLFSLYRARIAIADELHFSGIPDTAIDGGWEQNAWIELQHSAFVNEPRIIIPAGTYTPMAARHTGPCALDERFPHIKPRYAIAFDPNACQGPTQFPPVHYSRWLASAPGTLYVVADPAPTPP
jgi:hypothetical protein